MTVEDLSFILQYLDPEKPIYLALGPNAEKYTEAKSVSIVKGHYVISTEEI